MTELSRYTRSAVILLVVLRLAIGWQLLYEGLWKIQTLSTPRPWTSAGYLKNSVGPLRNTFRNMAGDPDDLGWLDYDTVSKRWLRWESDFRKHYRLDENQSNRLAQLLHGSQRDIAGRMAFAEPLEKLPAGVDKLNVSEKYVWFDAKAKQLYIDAENLLQPDEKAKLASLGQGKTDAESQKFIVALDRLYDRQKAGLGYLKKLAGAVKGNPDLLGNEDWQRLGKLTQYRQQLAAYEQDYAAATTAFEWDHLQHTWGKLQSLRGELTAPVKAMETELQEKAESMLSTDQIGLGPVQEPWTMLRFTDVMTIIGLTGLGLLLLLGLFTRFAAVAAAFMLFNFYMAMPPLPGVPEIPGPEHSFIINKNLIEVFALLAIATLPTGLWFGLDRLLSMFFRNWTADAQLKSPLKTTLVKDDHDLVAAPG